MARLCPACGAVVGPLDEIERCPRCGYVLDDGDDAEPEAPRPADDDGRPARQSRA